MSRTWGGRVRLALAGVVILCTAIASAAASATQYLVGVNEVRFAWAPAEGATHGYLVSVTRDGTALTPLSWVTEPAVRVRVAAGDRLVIAVQALRRNSSGTLEAGPYSPLSEVVQIVGSPRFPVTGEWTLTCAVCPSLAVRSLANASVLLAEVSALPAPWRIVGRAVLSSGGPELLFWHNPTTGEIDLWDAAELTPLPEGAFTGPPSSRAVGSADFDRDGIEELVIHQPSTNQVHLYGLTPGGLARVATLTGSATATLAAVEDFTGDRKIDLLWHNRTLGTLELRSVLGNSLLSLSLSSATIVLLGSYSTGAVVAETGDYDGDGETDLLWRYADGRLIVTYLVDGRVRNSTTLPAAAGDANQSVVGSVDVNGIAGDEIALQDQTTNAISILVPTYTEEALRIAVLTPGSRWKVGDVVRD